MTPAGATIIALAALSGTLATLLVIALGGNHHLAEENAILREERDDARALAHPATRSLRVVRGGRR